MLGLIPSMTLKIKLMSIAKPLLGSTNCYKSRLAKPVAKDQININTDRKSRVSYPKKVVSYSIKIEIMGT